MLSRRESALEALKTVISGSAFIKYVTRDVMPFEHLASTQFPMCMIEDLGDDDLTYKTSGNANITISLNLKIITKAEYSNNSSAINLADQDIVKQIAGSQKLGGLVSIMELRERETQDIETTYPYVVVVRKARIVYSENTSNGF